MSVPYSDMRVRIWIKIRGVDLTCHSLPVSGNAISPDRTAADGAARCIRRGMPDPRRCRQPGAHHPDRFRSETARAAPSEAAS